MLVSVTFTKSGHCTQLGNFGPGDSARVSQELAQHLVESARVAQYSQRIAKQTQAAKQTHYMSRRERRKH